MSSRRKRLSPTEIIGAVRLRIARIRARTANDTLDSYLANTERQDAVERNFIAIGEAIKDLSKMLDLAALD